MWYHSVNVPVAMKAFWVTEFCNQYINGIYMCEGPPVAGQAWAPSNVSLFEAHHTFSKRHLWTKALIATCIIFYSILFTCQLWDLQSRLPMSFYQNVGSTMVLQSDDLQCVSIDASEIYSSLPILCDKAPLFKWVILTRHHGIVSQHSHSGQRLFS